jgi:carboxypeptidase PM20D1
VELELVFDEGGDIISGKELGIDGTLALLGICEKGYLDAEIKGTSAGGHSSTPPDSTALGQACAAAARVEKAKFPAYFNEPTAVMFDSLAPYMDGKNKMMFANRWLFGRHLARKLCKSPKLAAFVRTTCALTQAYGSMAPNVLPQEARIIMNLRIASGESVQSALSHIREAAGDQVEVNIVTAMEPSPTSGVDNETYRKMMDLLGEMFPGMIAAPFPMVAATDSRNFYNVCPNVYRFPPYTCMREDHSRMHARDERMEIKSYLGGIAFYIRLLEKFCVKQ